MNVNVGVSLTPTKAQQYHINILLFFLPFLMGCGVDLYVPSLPAIAHSFHVDNNLVQMTIALYMLGYGLGQIVLGVLSDIYGRTKIVMFSTFLYTVISFLIAIYSPNIVCLIIYRFIQGIAMGGGAAVCRAIAADCYRGVALGKALTLISTSFGLGPILGPLIGAYLQYYFDWQADFYFFGVYGLILLVYANLKLPETIGTYHPLQLAKIMKNMVRINFHVVFLTSSVWGALAYAFLVVFTIVSPFLIQNGLHYSVIEYGKIILILGLAYFSGTVSNRFLLSYFAAMSNAYYGLLGMLGCSLILLVLTWMLPLSIVTLIIPTWFIFFFSGWVFPNSMTRSLDLFSHSAGTVSALFGSWLGMVVFMMTAIAGVIEINSQKSLALMFIAMAIMSLLLFHLGAFIEKRGAPEEA